MKTIEQLQSTFINHTYYKGVQCVKNPMDLWVYGEIIHEVQPDIIIEIGCFKGGSALWLADNSEAFVIGIDVDISLIDQRVRHDDLTFLKGDALDARIYGMVKNTVENKKGTKVIVIEDSAHDYDTTYGCLCLYSELVSIGSYYIVEDTICRDLGYSHKTYEAVDDFTRLHTEFEVDRTREKYITWNPGGFLRRVK